MVPKNVFIAILATALLAWSGVSMADEYRPDEFLTLDLAKAVLSPKRLAPASDFEAAAAAVEPKTDAGSEAAQALVAPEVYPDIVAPRTSFAHVRPEKPRGAVRARLAHMSPEKPRGAVRTRLAHVSPEKPRGAVRTRLAHRHGNPLDAEARDTRIQVWPCKSGGICDWQRAKK
jgi:hypothetical protein